MPGAACPPLLALTAALALTACTTEPTPAGPQARPSSTAPTSGQGAAAGAPTAAVVDPDAVLTVEDQVGRGPTVDVVAAVTTGGWVVVAADGGSDVLGAGRVPAGASSRNVQVQLADALTTRTELVARLFDDGVADGAYGAGDRPVTNDDADDDDAGPGESETFAFTGGDVTG